MEERSASRVYSGPLLAMVAHLRQVLHMYGIESEVRGEYRGAGLGEIPITEAWPELWVLDGGKTGEARRLVQEALTSGELQAGERECPKCREMVESTFSECWNCGASIP